MSTFTLAISCLTTSNLPWFMDLTSRFLCNIAFYSIGLIPSPVTSTTGCCFCFDSVFAFFFGCYLGHLFGVLVPEGLVGLHRTIQHQLLQHYWLGHRLGLLWYWVVCLRNEQRSFCRFWDCIQVLHFRLFCWPWWLLHFFWGIPAHSSRYNGHLS